MPDDETAKIVNLQSGPLVAHAIRIPSGQDLMSNLLEAAAASMATSNSSSAFVMTAVGSLKQVTLRMASADRPGQSNEIRTWNEKMEILSLVGTIDRDGSGKHLHMCLSKADGSTVGGHLIGGTIFTTLELCLGTIGGVVFDRQVDPATGFPELEVSQEQETPPPSCKVCQK